MEQVFAELLATGSDIGGVLLFWILYQQHKRLEEIEDWRKSHG